MITTPGSVGTIRRGSYEAHHIDEARRIAARDPHRPVAGQTIRLDGTCMIVVIVAEPRIVAARAPGRFEWDVPVGVATPFQAVIHQQIEVIDDSLRRSARQRRRAA